MIDYKKIRPLGKGIVFGVGALIFAAFLALLFGWVLMLLWNWLMPEIFGLPMIGYWQAWGLILLSHLLFKGGGAHGSSRRAPHFHPGQGRGPGRRPPHMHDNEGFDEFKKEFKDRMRARWHDHQDCEQGNCEGEEIIPKDEKD